MWQWFGRGLVVLAAVVLVASFAGDVHPIGDSLAVFRPVIFAGGMAVCLLVWRWRIAQGVAIAMIAAGLWHGAGFLAPAGSADTETDLTLYQKNLLFRPRDRGPFVSDVRAADADFVTLQEVSRANLPLLETLRAQYPHQVLCNGHRVGAVAILSKTPLSDMSCGTEPGFARAVSVVNGLPVQVITLHLFWPWPHNQPDHVAAILPSLAPLEGGVTMVGGDFNMVASGRTVAAIARATGTQRVGPLVETFTLFGYPLGIDHVLATGGAGTLDVRPLLGADHYGLLALITVP